MRRWILILLLSVVLGACGGAEETPATPTPSVPPATLPPTVTPAPTATPRPSPTPLSLSDLGTDLRTFINVAHNYALLIPRDWEVSPRGASHADRVEFAAPGPTQFRGANTLPPLVIVITALDPEAGYTSFDDLEARHPIGDEVLERFDMMVGDWPARRISSFDSVYGRAFHYIIQRDEEFFQVDVYGYDQAPSEPILQTLGPPPPFEEEKISGRIEALDSATHLLTLMTAAGETIPLQWFTDAEILPKGRLVGHLDPGDPVEVIAFALADGERQVARITLQTPIANDQPAVLEYQRVGGFAGFNERLILFADGTARLQQGEEVVREVQLSEEQWAPIKRYVSLFRPFAWHQEDNPGGPDNLVQDLDFYGAGKFETVRENEEEIVAYLQEVLATLTGA